ncbi:LuxR C-terminal-related transcriptional regulator [Mycolicibacterium agri]|uniref:LuxR C-terminal-related transcriptional regulator n=1 Tax=Mycolicibacterium agri TaxID=36811 RepID=UPI0013D05A36|nr:LuxR family transcriptional regulator [Mycolicibacterium agri]
MRAGWPLVGRDEELRFVSKAIANPGGTGGLVLAGAAGVGKTRLAREALSVAQRQGRRCHWIAATASARSVPLGAFAEFATDFGPDPLRRVLEVVGKLVADSAPMTVVVGIDDAHLLDEQSAFVVQQLVQRRAATVVLTHRSGEVAPDAISSLWKDERLPRMDLQPLSTEEVAELLTRVLDGEVEALSAEQLWRYTNGNVLYLRQLTTDEAEAGRLANRSGVWVWDANPDMSPTLLELIESTIGRQSKPVIEVLDIVSLAEPVELPVLLSVASSAAVDTAVERGLIRIDTDAQVARLAHPMFGDARRVRAGPLHLLDLRRGLVESIGRLCEPSPQQTIRRAVLVMDSAEPRDPALLRDGARAALALLDTRLAVRLAHCATQSSGGREADFDYASALAIAGHGRECEREFSRLAASAPSAAEEAQLAVMRAANLGFNLYDPASAEHVLDNAQAVAGSCGLDNAFAAIRSALRAASGQAASAVDLATPLLVSAEVAGMSRMMATWGLVWGLADLGEVARASAAAAEGYALARTTFDASHLRFGLGMGHVTALRLAGEVKQARATAELLWRDAQDEGSHMMSALLMCFAELAAGNLAEAQRWARASVARAKDYSDESPSSREICADFLATALAMAGELDAARQALSERPRRIPDGYRYWHPDRTLAEAWIDAAAGAPSKAARAALTAADEARSLGRPAREVVCLQAAAQFGNPSGAERLAQLTSVVEGPRVTAAAAHAHALAEHDDGGLVEASRRYEEFGDRVAAGDAAAQAAAISRKGGHRGSGLTAAAIAERLARKSGADTPALRACRVESPLTDRQREIISLAAQGLSNHEIAEQLVLSVRTVEGHIFQASQKAGVNTREELIALMNGQPRGFE